jgi:Protein of unknown function (DUF5818)
MLVFQLHLRVQYWQSKNNDIVYIAYGSMLKILLEFLESDKLGGKSSDMSVGTTHIIEGVLITDTTNPVLLPDAGDQWRLDLVRRFHSLSNMRVRVEDIRSDFDMLDVTKVVAL